MVSGSKHMRLATRMLTGAVLAATMILGLTGPAGADTTYVSLQGEFYFQYPDDWAQVDYLTVDYYLSALGADSSAYGYDAVFATKKSGGRFHDHEYLILTIEPVGNLTMRQRDSVVAELADANPVWDKKNNVVRVVNADPTSPKSTMLAMKFYNKGVAHFYFFAPDSTFEAYRPVFDSMLASFSTENVAAMLPKEEVTLGDPDRLTTESKPEDESGSGSMYPWYAVIVVFVILMAVIIRKKRARARQE